MDTQRNPEPPEKPVLKSRTGFEANERIAQEPEPSIEDLRLVIRHKATAGLAVVVEGTKIEGFQLKKYADKSIPFEIAKDLVVENDCPDLVLNYLDKFQIENEYQLVDIFREAGPQYLKWLAKNAGNYTYSRLQAGIIIEHATQLLQQAQ